MSGSEWRLGRRPTKGVKSRMDPVAGDRSDEGTGVLQSIWQFRWVVVAATILGALAGYIWSLGQTPVYAAASQLVLSGQADVLLALQPQAVPDPDRYLRNQVQIVTSTPVLARAVELSKLDVSTSELASMVEVEAADDADIITIRVFTDSGRGAATLADALAHAYQAESAEQAKRVTARAIGQLTAYRAEVLAVLRALEAPPKDPFSLEGRVAQRDTTVSELSELANRIQQLRIAGLLSGDRVQLIEPAAVPTRPVEPQPQRTVAVTALVALLASSGLAWWLAGRSPTTLGHLRGGWGPRRPRTGAQQQDGSVEPAEASTRPGTPSPEETARQRRAGVSDGVDRVASSTGLPGGPRERTTAT